MTSLRSAVGWAVSGLFLLTSAHYAQAQAPAAEVQRGEVLAVKNGYVKLDLVGAGVNKGDQGTVVHGEAEQEVGRIVITATLEAYSVGKVDGTPEVGDVVLLGEIRPASVVATLEAAVGEKFDLTLNSGDKLRDLKLLRIVLDKQTGALKSLRAEDPLSRERSTIEAGEIASLVVGGKTLTLGDAPAPQTGRAEIELAATPLSAEEFDKLLLTMHQQGDLYRESDYPTLRNLAARRFADEHAAEIEQAFGDKYQAMTAWLDEQSVLKEELYTAFGEGDNVVAGLQLFQKLRAEFPDDIVRYGNLAIATCVVWDDSRRGVYYYQGHQRRVQASMPEEHADAIENFRYLVNTEKYMQGRILYVPWEFLRHVVNHTTPIAERQWAMTNYLQKRVGFGKCYHDVPYDNDLLERGGSAAKLNGHAYNFANLVQRGGVCAHQADFASRVGKSIGVSAEYVRGEARGGELHAWVMWIELKSATAKSIGFTLESYGRYRGDRYYVGTLLEPQSGKRITDRRLELRLHTVGMNTVAKRQADLIMRNFPRLVELAELGPQDRVDALRKVVELCPGNEAAWTAVAGLSGDIVETPKDKRQMLTMLDTLFNTFANFPDFTWEIFDNLVSYEDDAEKRNQLYARLILLYEQADRPDLACEARLKLSELLVADDHKLPAVEGLAVTILKFPDEGRYVPKMLDKLEVICDEIEGSDQHLIGFYTQYLPRIPKRRGDRPSPYCMAMYERAIERFNELGQPQLAQAVAGQLEKIKVGAK